MSILYEHYNTGDDGQFLISSADTWIAQTFTPSIAHTITSVKLLLFRGVGATPGTLTVHIKATDVSGHPTGDDLCSGTTDGDTLTTNSAGEWREITLGAGALLGADTKYAIILEGDGASGSDTVSWRDDSSSPTYTNGNHEHSDNNGTSWTGWTGRDFMFEEWGEAIGPPAGRSFGFIFG